MMHCSGSCRWKVALLVLLGTAVTGPPKDDVYSLGFRYMNGCCTAVTSLPAPKEDWPPRDAPRVRFELVPGPN
jgi:hypothetical protein